MLCLAVPDPIGLDRLEDTGLPDCYRDFMSKYGVGVIGDGWRMQPPERLRKVTVPGGRSMICVGRSLQGDDYAVSSDGAVWQLQDPDEPAFVSASLDGWINAWLDGSAHTTIITPWFVPDGVDWNGAELCALTADEPASVVDRLVAAMPGSLQLTRIDGTSSVQSHVWWAQTWVVATAVAAGITRGEWDLRLRLRTEGDVDARGADLVAIVGECGWIAAARE